MNRKKILWLVSWYPNRKDRYDGDFIQRHARAAAIYHDIHVIFVTPDDITEPEEEVLTRATGLTEQVIYYKARKGIASKLSNHFLWKKVFLNAIENYITRNGKPGLVHVHVPWKAGILALHLKNDFQVPYIITEHWGIYNDRVSDNFGVQPFYVKRYIKRIVAEAGKVITVSRYAGEGMKRFLPFTNYEIIPNVVDSTLFMLKTEKYTRFSFIHVSNMVSLKNVGSILSAFQSFLEKTGADAQLIMIGDRDDYFRNIASGMDLLNRSVFFRGEISYREVAEEMGRCHCFVIFSDTETFSCVTAEALCCGLPVIASRAGALPELVNEENGILVAPGDINALSLAMERMYRTPGSFNPAKISDNASEKFNYSAIADRFSRLYGEGL